MDPTTTKTISYGDATGLTMMRRAGGAECTTTYSFTQRVITMCGQMKLASLMTTNIYKLHTETPTSADATRLRLYTGADYLVEDMNLSGAGLSMSGDSEKNVWKKWTSKD